MTAVARVETGTLLRRLLGGEKLGMPPVWWSVTANGNRLIPHHSERPPSGVVNERLWAEVERGKCPNVSLETALRMLNLVGVSIRLDDPQGSHHVLKVPDPSGAADARAARAAICRATWKGQQMRLGEQKDSPI